MKGSRERSPKSYQGGCLVLVIGLVALLTTGCLTRGQIKAANAHAVASQQWVNCEGGTP